MKISNEEKLYHINEIINKCIISMERSIDLFGCEQKQIINMSQYVNFKIQGIYFLIHNNEIVYIGQTVNLLTRMSNHHILKNEKCKISFLQVENEGDLDVVECFYIRKFKPKLNRDKKGCLKGRNGAIGIEGAIIKKLSTSMAYELTRK